MSVDLTTCSNAELIEHLKAVEETALADSGNTESEFCVGPEEHERVMEERNRLSAVLDETIRRLGGQP